ncbi:MAG: LysE family translocator [Comamonadaceae bacterium]|jgi:threonine/homoserine/homoserine lactone efflux protein|nr:LysE family translocator [Comamonadaceae bacterium]
MNASEFWALVALATAMSFTPGPNTTLSTALAANGGLRHALPFVCSVPVGWSLLLLACGLGLGALILAVPALVWVVKAMGVGYLWWLAAKLARTSRLGEAGERLKVGFFQGMALQFVNIKAWMLALTVVSGWVAGHGDLTARLSMVLPIMMVFALGSNLSYALVGSMLRHWLAGPDGTARRLVWFNRSMATVLVLTGLWMLTR